MSITEDDIDFMVDELMEFAEREGERMGREHYGEDYDTMPKGPEIGHLLRADLRKALMKRYGLPC